MIAARFDEIQQIRNHNVYEKIPLEGCHQRTGKAPIKVKWVDINKGDEINKEYRSRLVAKEIKRDKREDLFAATPPLEAKKMFFSMAVTEEIGHQSGHPEEGMKIGSIDIVEHTFRQMQSGTCTSNFLTSTGNKECVGGC